LATPRCRAPGACTALPDRNTCSRTHRQEVHADAEQVVVPVRCLVWQARVPAEPAARDRDSDLAGVVLRVSGAAGIGAARSTASAAPWAFVLDGSGGALPRRACRASGLILLGIRPRQFIL